MCQQSRIWMRAHLLKDGAGRSNADFDS
jgi:hypothetical protein